MQHAVLTLSAWGMYIHVLFTKRSHPGDVFVRPTCYMPHTGDVYTNPI